MGIAQELLDFGDMFHRQMKHMPRLVNTDDLLDNQNMPGNRNRTIVVNRLTSATRKDKDIINNNLYTRYKDSSSISSIPSCDCPTNPRMGRYQLGIVCDHCGSEVKLHQGDEIQSVLWIKAPNRILGLLNPVIWTMLSNRFKKQGFDTIRWLCDTDYRSPVLKPRPIITLEEILKQAGIERGYNNFVRHFDLIMEILFERANLRPQGMVRDDLRELIRRHRDILFSEYLPLPNKLLMVVEETNFFTYYDKEMAPAIDALWSIAGIDSELSNLTFRQRENRTVRAIALLAEYHNSSMSKTYMKKEGIYRGHTYGWRSIFAFRTVITSNTAPHRYDEIHIPWGVAVTLFRFHLINKLYNKYEMSPKEIIHLLHEHTVKYHPLLDKLFKELIDESPDSYGIAVLGVRNPSLKRGSAQQLYITHVKTDVNDTSTSISILIVKPLNAFNNIMHSFFMIALGSHHERETIRITTVSWRLSYTSW